MSPTQSGIAGAARPLVNAHIHLPPNFTAFDSTEQALDAAKAQEVRALGASNYYDYAVYADFAEKAGQRGIFPLFGIEIITLINDLVKADVKINDPGNPGKMYLCGKGITRFDPMSDEALALLEVIRTNDSARMAAMAGRLGALFADAGLANNLNAEAIIGHIAARYGIDSRHVYLQERHLAQAFQEALFDNVAGSSRNALLDRLYQAAPKADADNAAGVQNDIRTFLMKAGKPAFAPDTFVDFTHGYKLILALGGIPCYPTLADGANPITQYEASVDELISDLKARGIYAAEFIPVRNSPEVLSQYALAMRDAGLILTAGTEHNTLEMLPIAPTCLVGAPIPDGVQEIFWEGACVVAAHQTLTQRGEAGYVDSSGKLNSAYGSDDSRIDAFRKVGEAAIMAA